MLRRKGKNEMKVIGSSKRHLPFYGFSIHDHLNSEDDTEAMDVDGAKSKPRQKTMDSNDLSEYNLNDYDNDEADPNGELAFAFPVLISISIRQQEGESLATSRVSHIIETTRRIPTLLSKTCVASHCFHLL
jgi:hypothetical protein